MQAQRALGQTPMEERAMANREQKSNREKKKPKKDKPKDTPVVSSFGVPSKPSGKGK
jgi:hypothetical protein